MRDTATTAESLGLKYMDLGAQWEIIKDEVQPKLDAFFKKGYYIGGGEVESFEEAFAKWTNTKYAIGCSNGTDGLKLALQSLNLTGRVQVVIPANTYIADAYCVKYQQGDFSFELIDHDEFFQIDTNLLRKHLEKHRGHFAHVVLLPVHLYGHPCDMESIMDLAEEFDCKVIEDASQSHGARTNNGKMVGEYGDLCVYSLYPGKNLGAIGDAGIITTNNEKYRDRLLALRNLGSVKKYEHDVDGWNNRLDSIQAIILEAKLKYIDKWSIQRRRIAKIYNNGLSGVKGIRVPQQAPYAQDQVFHVYCLSVDNREEFQKHLKDNGVHTVVHYPIPIEKSLCNKDLKFEYDNVNTLREADNIVSLPMHPFMTTEQAEFVVDLIKDFRNNS